MNTHPPHKCFGGTWHRWKFTKGMLPRCFDCGKTGPEVAELKRQWLRAERKRKRGLDIRGSMYTGLRREE